MKKIILLLAVFISLVAFKTLNKKNLAEVEQIQGYYIFVDSKPVCEYDYITTVKVPVISMSSGQYQSVRDILIKKARKDFPGTGDALIFHFYDGGIDKADIVKLKE